jgi:hypothetical protein
VQAGIKRVFSYSEKYWVKAAPDQPNRWEIALDILAEGHVAVSAPNLRLVEAAHWTEKKVAANLRKKQEKERADAAKAAESGTVPSSFASTSAHNENTRRVPTSPADEILTPRSRRKDHVPQRSRPAARTSKNAKETGSKKSQSKADTRRKGKRR